MWPQDKSTGLRVSSSLSTQSRHSPGQAMRELLLWEALASCWLRRSMALNAVFIHSPFHLHGSRCDQDSPINPASIILFLFSPLPFFFGRVQTLLWSLFCSGSLLSWPGARGPVPTASL